MPVEWSDRFQCKTCLTFLELVLDKAGFLLIAICPVCKKSWTKLEGQEIVLLA